MTSAPAAGPAIRALLVEDDSRIRYVLTLALTDMGFWVSEAGSGEEALELLEHTPVDVILLDLMLPKMDGLTVCRAVRAHSDIPIIIVTARSDTVDVIEGLEAGADDYMSKPLVASELVARIRALLRRSATPQTHAHGDRLRIGDLSIDPDAGEVRRAGEALHLTKTEFRLLLELAAAAGRVVTREELLQRVWGYDYFGDTRLLDVHIRRLRRKVEIEPSDPTLLKTVRGVGYRLERPS